MSEPTPAELDEDERLQDDERAHPIFFELFNPIDDCYQRERDGGRFRACVGKLVALGYSESVAREYLNTGLSYCDD